MELLIKRDKKYTLNDIVHTCFYSAYVCIKQSSGVDSDPVEQLSGRQSSVAAVDGHSGAGG